MNMNAYLKFMSAFEDYGEKLNSPYIMQQIADKLTAGSPLRKKYESKGITDTQQMCQLYLRNDRQKEREIRLFMEMAQVFQIDNKHKHLLLLTSNPKEKDVDLWKQMRLPFPEIFIDVSFDYGDLDGLANNVHGILLREERSIVGDWHENKSRDEEFKHTVVYGLTCYCLAEKEDGGGYINKFMIPLTTKNSLDGEQGADLPDTALSEDKKLHKFIREFVMNFILFLKDQEVVYVSRPPPDNQRRVKKGKRPLPPSKTIQLTGELKIYVDGMDFTGFRGKQSHRYFVRGHYRHYRSDKYKSMKGKVVFIAPHIRGQGVLIRKVRQVVPDTGEELNYEDI